MAELSVRLFGKLTVLRDGQQLAGFEPRKVQELFCHLLLRRTQPQSREVLTDMLWGDLPPAQARKGLRQTLWQLQRALEQGDAAPMLVADSEWVTITDTAPLWVDVAIFEAACRRCEGVAGATLDEPRAAELVRAVELYQGDLLEGCYHDWCIYERERLQGLYLAALDRLLCYSEARGAFEAGIGYGLSALRIHRACERTHRQLMRLYHKQGDRSAALRQYERCVTALDQELGVTPSARTEALAAQIRADAADSAHPPEAAPGLSHVLAGLYGLQATIAATQREVQAQIEAVEQLLRRLR